MNIAIFAGGAGTRLWPLSRKSTPKQFEKIVGDKSTLQMAVNRLLPNFKLGNIYISTGKKFKGVIEKHVEGVPQNNFIFEPETRDVGPAVGLAMTVIGHKHPDTPVAILWSDHAVKKERRFREVLTWAEDLVTKKPNSLIFVGQRARFANQNIGWIEFDKEKERIRDTKVFGFKRLIYRPSLEDAERFFHSREFAWNPGYFVTTPRFLLSQYKKFMPQMWASLMQIQKAVGTSKYEKTLKDLYPTLEKISFDNAILERIDPKRISVIAAAPSG